MVEKRWMSKTLSKYITAFEYADKTLLVSSFDFTCFFNCRFTIIIGTTVGITSASISSVFLISNVFESKEKERNKHIPEKTEFKVLIFSNISYE